LFDTLGSEDESVNERYTKTLSWVSGHLGAPEAHLHLVIADRFDAKLAVGAGNSADPNVFAFERW
jgi:hypothetical protein